MLFSKIKSSSLISYRADSVNNYIFIYDDNVFFIKWPFKIDVNRHLPNNSPAIR